MVYYIKVFKLLLHKMTKVSTLNTSSRSFTTVASCLMPINYCELLFPMMTFGCYLKQGMMNLRW